MQQETAAVHMRQAFFASVALLCVLSINLGLAMPLACQ